MFVCGMIFLSETYFRHFKVSKKFQKFKKNFVFWGLTPLTFFSKTDIFIMGMCTLIKILLALHYINIAILPR